jgi:hypothetical protein
MSNYSVSVLRSGKVKLCIDGVEHYLMPSDIAHIACCVLRGLRWQSGR